jgi:hypothetical protein
LAAMGYTNVAHYPARQTGMDGGRSPGGEGCVATGANQKP